MARETSQTLEKLRARPHAYSSCRWSQWAGWICECGLSKEIFAASLEAAAAKPEPVQLVEVDGSSAKETEINADAKTAAQVDMKIEEKRKTLRRERRKLALLQQTVQLSQQVLEQKKLLAQSKQQLQHLCQSRVKYVKQHKFWRGHVIADYKSAVVETRSWWQHRLLEKD